VLHRLGLTPTEAIRLFYQQVTLHRGLPFPVRIPNATTRKAMEEARRGRHLTHWPELEAAKSKLG
jgi:DNA-damage-inducible protein J